MQWERPTKAGMLYAFGVFVVGFAFGVVRMMLLEPNLGELWPIIIEVPIILGVSWILCQRAIAVLRVSGDWRSRALMAVVSLTVLLIAEITLWTMMFDYSLVTFFVRYTTLAGAIGLIGQITFASFPMLHR